ncbi:MAG: hydroxymethylglutaryl-CoA synthase family protein [Haliscomenobacter sp.]|nr:hydroxymethylglutaryl-CoA synthase family protein [Haliscomenobacter sp.]
MSETNLQTGMGNVGIDDLAVYIPRIFLPMDALANARGYDFGKLRDGLGLQAMAFPDVHEDPATMAANAVLDLILRNRLDPRQVGRIYMGTESAVDGSKPTASYVVDMLTQYFSREYGEDCFLECDVVDLTFACIGAVDALQNTLDWVRAGQDRIGIIVSSDVAKYELGSGGEYTQGAGAIAALVSQQPPAAGHRRKLGRGYPERTRLFQTRASVFQNPNRCRGAQTGGLGARIPGKYPGAGSFWYWSGRVL